MQTREKKYLDVKSFSRQIGVKPTTIRKWMNRREINYAKIGPPNVDLRGRDRRKVMIPVEEVERLVENVPRVIDSEL